MGYESIAHEAEGESPEAMRARGIIVLVKSNQLVQKISRLNICRKLKLDINPLLPPKHCKYGGAFRYSWAITYSLLVAQPIRT